MSLPFNSLKLVRFPKFEEIGKILVLHFTIGKGKLLARYKLCNVEIKLENLQKKNVPPLL